MKTTALRRLALVLSCCWSLNVTAGLLSDDENKAPPKEEGALVLPAPPKSEDLLRYTVGPSASMTFAVDAKSVSVGDDQIVRYSSVIISSSGAKNISYEGIRCTTAERKLFATGRADGSWNTLPDAEWRQISSAGANSYQATLFKEFFCNGESVAGKTSTIIDRIRRNKPLR